MPWLGFVTGVAAIVFVSFTRQEGPGALARNAAFIFLAFFAFSKQAFYNYYFLVVGCLCCALVAWSTHGSIDGETGSSIPVDTGTQAGRQGRA
jgi:hypothetical protein